jgi:hypothetical protein
LSAANSLGWSIVGAALSCARFFSTAVGVGERLMDRRDQGAECSAVI